MTRLVQRGVPRHVLEVAAGLDSDRFEVEVVAGRGEEEEGSLWEEAKRRGIVTSYIPALVRPISPAKDLAAYRAISRKVRDGRYQIVHTHISKAGILGRLAAWRGRTPVIVHTYHGRVEEVHEGTLRSRLLLRCERRAARRTDVIVAVSASTAELCLGSGIGCGGQYRVIYNGIDAEQFRAGIGQVDLPSRLRGKRLIGAVGSLTREKGMDLLLGAFPLLLTKCPDLHMVILGDGQLRQSLERTAAELGAGERVFFAGNVDDVRPWMERFEVVLIPSRTEGSPTVLLESMALGRPVVAAAVGGIPELLEDGESGLLVPPEDAAALSMATTSLLLDADRRSALGSAARRRVDAGFSLDQSISKLEQVYEAQLQAKNIET